MSVLHLRFCGLRRGSARSSVRDTLEEFIAMEIFGRDDSDEGL